MFQLIQKLYQHFWSRWFSEYIAELQMRTKWKVNQSNLEQGQLVLLRDDNLPPECSGTWGESSASIQVQMVKCEWRVKAYIRSGSQWCLVQVIYQYASTKEKDQDTPPHHRRQVRQRLLLLQTVAAITTVHTKPHDEGKDLHRITQYTPAEIAFGYHLRTDTSIQDVVEKDILDVTTIRTEVTRRLEENRVKQDLSFNKKLSPATNESKKLLPKFRGPFKVVEVLPNDRYRVQEDRHTDRSSRPYEGIVGIEHMKPLQFNRLLSFQAIVASRTNDLSGWPCSPIFPSSLTNRVGGAIT
ncbi:hypothetical protein NQ318_003040 [Aromia moschata]|uniref:DUF5641 domain-containing protein n=1 Tax=Aromia moschata TaxID=1265417 RepID=A0AAV8X0R0_9CUCU|nr:hypothetical protein NQ318_003040 [Aromia moschata]